MTTRITICVLAMALAASPLAAQQGGINQRLAAGQPAKYTRPLCPLNAINAKVKKGEEVLRKSYDAKTPADKAAMLAEARQNLVAAITQEAQANNPGSLVLPGARGPPARRCRRGRLRIHQGAGSSLPSCEIDITQYRQNNWAMLANVGIEFQKKGDVDSALALFREANLLFRTLPHVYSNMGVVFANSASRRTAPRSTSPRRSRSPRRDTSLVRIGTPRPSTWR
jgi:Flp pilus assembly protein TadD